MMMFVIFCKFEYCQKVNRCFQIFCYDLLAYYLFFDIWSDTSGDVDEFQLALDVNYCPWPVILFYFLKFYCCKGDDDVGCAGSGAIATRGGVEAGGSGSNGGAAGAVAIHTSHF
jgi:hypothetical protein